MHNLKHVISVCFLMLSALFIVTTSIIPHHHCDDGSICLILDMHNDEHHHNSSGCDDNCAMNVELIQDATQIGHASKAGFIPQLIAILPSQGSLLPEPIEQSTTLSFVFILYAYHDIIGSSCGLRAPPTMA